MKKSTKVCLIIALVMFLCSIGCIAAGLAMTGNTITAITDIFDNISQVFHGYEEDFDKDYQLEDFQLAGQIPKDSFDSMKLDMSVGKVVVKSVSSESCSVWVDKEDYISVYDKDSTLCIMDESESFDVLDGKVSSIFDMVDLIQDEELKNVGANVIIEVPEDSLYTFNIDMQLGAIKFYEMSVDQMDVHVDVGSVFSKGTFSGDTLKVTTELGSAQLEYVDCNAATFSVELGDAAVQSVKADKLMADVELGSIDLKHVVAEETKADCELGDIDIQFVGTAKDYDISSDVELGDIDIANHGGKNAGARYKARLDCELGDIDVTFVENVE